MFNTIYEQDSFEPVARLVWLQDGVEIAANEPVYHDNPHIKLDTNKPPKIQVYHCHNDHLGTPNELTNDKGEVVWLADYEAWGNTAKVVYKELQLYNIAVSADELQPLRFQGQFIDQETGLHYNRFRYFDPDLGMFISRDPIGLMGGNNVFQYAPNPVGWIDPFGLEKIYRGMKGNESPVVESSARGLGVRENIDIIPDAQGMVSPDTGGMSMSPSPQDLPEFRRPPEFGGTGKDPVWKIDTGDLGDDLRYVPDKPGHGTIQPSRTMLFSEYQQALARLKDKFKKVSACGGS